MSQSGNTEHSSQVIEFSLFCIAQNHKLASVGFTISTGETFRRATEDDPSPRMDRSSRCHVER